MLHIMETEITLNELVMANETFSIEFNGSAFDDHQISASALAQSLLALDGLSQKTASVLYGKDAQVDVKVKTGFRPGSFIVDLIVEEVSNHPLASTASVVAVITGLFNFGKWALGKKVKTVEDDSTKKEIKVENEAQETMYIDRSVVLIYNTERARSHMSRMTQTLDADGVSSIRIFKPENGVKDAVISREERKYFKREEGIVLTDNESEVILYVVSASFDGSRTGWKFSEGDEAEDGEGIKFSAVVEDEDFLEAVKSRKIALSNGTAIRAVLRVVQRKTSRTMTDRSIVEVKEVIQPV